MQIMPFLSVCWVIAGMASLGLPGLSGFVSEMNIFMGAFMHEDLFHRVITIVACASIVVTAVYILRVIGKILYGAVVNEHHRELTDATWYERIAAVTLIVFIAVIGCLPFFPTEIIGDSLGVIVSKF